MLALTTIEFCYSTLIAMFYKILCLWNMKQDCVTGGEFNTIGWVCDSSVAVLFGRILLIQKVS